MKDWITNWWATTLAILLLALIGAASCHPPKNTWQPEPGWAREFTLSDGTRCASNGSGSDIECDWECKP